MHTQNEKYGNGKKREKKMNEIAIPFDCFYAFGEKDSIFLSPVLFNIVKYGYIHLATDKNG